MMLKTRTHRISVVMADDDPDDCLMTLEAFESADVRSPIEFVHDGRELLDYLRREGKYAGRTSDEPGLILLDLNMPRIDGREALARIRQDADLRHIPVVVLTTSSADEDIVRSYDLGVAGYVTKPVTFDGLIDVVRAVSTYWFLS